MVRGWAERAVWLGLVVGGVGLACAAGWSCLVESRCYTSQDCPKEQHCMADFKCHALQCTEPDDRRCFGDRPHCWLAENQCVECLVQDHCEGSRPFCVADKHRCVECLHSTDCLGAGEDCVAYSCVLQVVPDFTLPDKNPQSETFEQTVTFSSHEGKVRLIYFAGLA